MQEDRTDAAEADEDGRGGDEEYEINSMGGTGEHEKPSGEAQGAVVEKIENA